jgi:hypothetical protein
MNDERMTCERLVDALDDYLDTRLSGTPAGEADVERHLAGCAACRALVADVRALRAAARTLEPIEPPAHVWQAVRAGVADARLPRRRAERAGGSLLERLGFSSSGWQSVLQPLGAAAALVLMVAGLTWVSGRLAPAPPALPAPTVAAGGQLVEFQLAEAEYTDAIERLEEATQSASPQLDTATTEALRASIDDIDMAIGDARDALAREPGDTVSQDSLLDALSSKVALLQDTVARLGNLEPGTEVQTP